MRAKKDPQELLAQKLDEEADQANQTLEVWGMSQAPDIRQPQTWPKYDVNKKEWENRAAIRAARILYLKEYPFERIYLLTQIPPQKYAKFEPVWNKLRGRIDEILCERIRAKVVSDRADELVSKGLEIGVKYMNRVLKREVELGAKDFKLVMDAVANIHRIGQLEKGEATDITQYKDMHPKQMAAYLVEVAQNLKKKHGDIYEIPVDVDVPEDERLQLIAQDAVDSKVLTEQDDPEPPR